jgi:hypothetical protein
MKEFTAGTATNRARIASLKGAGRKLFKVAPKLFRDAFWELMDSKIAVKNIAIVSEEPFIPWELMIPHRSSDKDRDPLGVEFCIGRWTSTDLKSPRQELALIDSYVVAPVYQDVKMQLAHSEDEAKFVASIFKGERITPAQFDSIAEKLTGGGRSLFHFVCHGVAAEGASQAIELENDEQLTSTQIEGLGLQAAFEKLKPIIFLNACEVGRLAPSLVGLGGFAPAFIEMGAGAVIAPLWSVKDGTAYEIASEFYNRLKNEPNVSFAEILRGIRKKAYVQGDDTYAAYCFYGDPAAFIPPVVSS